LRELLESSGLTDVVVGSAEPRASYINFDDLWNPIAARMGPTGAYIGTLEAGQLEALRQEYRRLLKVRDEPFELTARAWIATGEVS
jgi:hypothetical protein